MVDLNIDPQTLIPRKWRHIMPVSTKEELVFYGDNNLLAILKYWVDLLTVDSEIAWNAPYLHRDIRGLVDRIYRLLAESNYPWFAGSKGEVNIIEQTSDVGGLDDNVHDVLNRLLTKVRPVDIKKAVYMQKFIQVLHLFDEIEAKPLLAELRSKRSWPGEYDRRVYVLQPKDMFDSRKIFVESELIRIEEGVMFIEQDPTHSGFRFNLHRDLNRPDVLAISELYYLQTNPEFLEVRLSGVNYDDYPSFNPEEFKVALAEVNLDQYKIPD